MISRSAWSSWASAAATSSASSATTGPTGSRPKIATHAIGGLSLGLYRDVLDEEAAYLLNYGEARLVFAEDEEQVDKLLDAGRPRAASEAHRLFRSARHAQI